MSNDQLSELTRNVPVELPTHENPFNEVYVLLFLARRTDGHWAAFTKVFEQTDVNIEWKSCVCFHIPGRFHTTNGLDARRRYHTDPALGSRKDLPDKKENQTQVGTRRGGGS